MSETSKSTKPFPEALRNAMDAHGVGNRELSRRTKEVDGWGSIGTIQLLIHGEMRPTMDAMEKLARALRMKPEYFAEYRLAKARAELDETVVGLEKALKNLKR